MFSIFILTHNEEIDIAACIESAQLSDDIIVVDSFSSDRTLQIASQYSVQIVQHAFKSHGKQRTWMLQNIPTKHDWVYILEADERMTPELFLYAVYFRRYFRWKCGLILVYFANVLRISYCLKSPGTSTKSSLSSHASHSQTEFCL
ncbi:glycosyltransferase [Spirulina sp. 06S082]|nr:glycosyltransferase [Spirulina sp. 06S082]MEA5472512.1 glycosyltransferase [Spirulina sp. 06S082]